MATAVETVNAYLKALQEKDLDRALACFADDAVADSPFGPQVGKPAIRGALEKVIVRPAPNGTLDVKVDGAGVIAEGATPNGPISLRFEFKGDLIAKQSIQIG